MKIQIPAEFIPKSILELRTYSWNRLLHDLIAGLTVGLVALPLAMAFAISSGVKPEAGLYCAVVAGFLISALGGSRVQIGGPTGAFVVVVAGIVAKFGLDGLFMCTMLAGVLLVILGATGLGTAVKFIPRPVVIGFTNGIAILIASTEIKDFFGLRVDHVPGDFASRIEVLAKAWHSYTPLALWFAVGAIAAIVICSRLSKRIPGSIIVLFIATAVAWVLALPMETIGTRFGGIPSGLPAMHIPTFRPDLILPLLGPVFTVTMLGAIESLLSAVVADRMIGDRHNPNVELIGQGIANFFSPLFGGLPATGAIARTATNARSGATSPVAGMVHALTLLLILLFAAPLAKHIPLAILAAILMVVAYNMGEWKEIPEIIRQSKPDASVWLITFLLTVFADLTVAVEAGMILAALLYIRKVTATTTVERVTPEYVERGYAHSLQVNEIPEEVAIFRIHGPFLFGSSDKLNVVYDQLSTLPPVVMLRLRNMTAIDATGLHAIERLADDLHASGRHLVLCGMREQPARLTDRAELDQHVGPENITRDLASGLERARVLLGTTPMEKKCTA